MRLAHLHIPGVIPFARASRIQNTLVSRILARKREEDSLRRARDASNGGQTQPPVAITPPLDPTILTFTPEPVYTTGRRDAPPHLSPEFDPSSSSSSSTSKLTLPSVLEPVRPLLEQNPPAASWHPTLRGGLTTYHGPGQLVIYTIMDLRSLRLGPRTHIRALEDSVIDVLARFNLKGIRTEDPGVWIPDSEEQTPALEKASKNPNSCSSCPTATRKVAAVGVHLRRFVSSYGVGLNVTNEPLWYFSQIVPCGLVGKEATSLEREGVSSIGGEGKECKLGTNEGMSRVADTFVNAFVGRVNQGFDGGKGVKEVYRITEQDVGVD